LFIAFMVHSGHFSIMKLLSCSRLGFGPAALASVALLLSQPQAGAATLVSNLNNTSVGSNIVGDIGAIFANGGIYGRIAQKFTAGVSAVIGSATLFLDTGGTNTDQLRVDIYSDNAGNPGTSLAQLTGPGNPAAGQNTWTGTVPVTGGSSYWVVTSVTSFPLPQSAAGQKKFWSYTDDLSQTGDAGWSIADDQLYSFNNGISWTSFSDSSQMLSISGDVSAAPEPGRSALLMIGLAGAALRRRRA
jgi:hypothetical protein